MRNIMINLETLNTASNSVIVSIGAVKFNEREGVTDRFYKTIDIDSCLKKGLTVSGGALCFWIRQKKNVRGEVNKNAVTLGEALNAFNNWLTFDGEHNYQVWSEGVGFHNAILSNAYQTFNKPPPWKYWDNRCYLTIKNSYDDVFYEHKGVKGVAVDDAESHAIHLLKIKDVNKIKKLLI